MLQRFTATFAESSPFDETYALVLYDTGNVESLKDLTQLTFVNFRECAKIEGTAVSNKIYESFESKLLL